MLAAPAFVAAAAILTSTAAVAAEDHADFLFVQTADAMRFDAASSKLSLDGVGSTTLFFADRPERIAGNMTTEAFVPFWSTGKDSFLSDPPNADVSILEGGQLRQVVVVLKDPVLEGDALTYTVELVSGEMPASGERRVGLHRRHRHAADAGLLRRRGPAFLPPRGALLKPRPSRGPSTPPAGPSKLRRPGLYG